LFILPLVVEFLSFALNTGIRYTVPFVSALPANQKHVLDAYVAGVNAFIDQTNLLPPEFIALNFSPGPWRAEDSILVALGMFQTLNGREQDERMVRSWQKRCRNSWWRF
jgi:acyl-homoserine lactone acylase PvdQ